MAKLWIVYREGLRLLGAPVADVAVEAAISRLDIAPWRMFTARPPERVPLETVQASPARRRALLGVGEEDRYELCGLSVGFYDSPYSPDECMRRLNLSVAAAP